MGMDAAPFEDRKIYIPPMTYTGSRAVAASLAAYGFDADVLEPSDADTLELGSRFASGDECYPLKITLGDILKLFFLKGHDPERTAIFMPVSEGPCRFGQYVPLIQKILKDRGLGQVLFMSPNCVDGYGSFKGYFEEMKLTVWIGIVASDILRKLLLRFRPYETTYGSADNAYEVSLDQICGTIKKFGKNKRACLREVKGVLCEVKKRFDSLPIREERRPIIGVVGEIFCRLNKFSNMDLLRKVESFGGEAWQSDVAEWVYYTDRENERMLARSGKRFSFEMLSAKTKYFFQKRVEHELYSPFTDHFSGREEPEEVTELLDLASPYLSKEGALGEMILSVGKTHYYHGKGTAGVIDISPFSCMNGIVSESIYYRLSGDLGGFPIRIFYFDEIHRDITFELEIFMDMARGYERAQGDGRKIEVQA